MPTITPNQIFQVKQYSISIIISIILILFGYSIFFVFFGQIKSQKTQDGTRIYLPVSKIYLYLSITSFGISIITTILSLYIYKKIFPKQKSRTLYWLYCAFTVTFAGILLNIVYLVQNFPQCPENQIFIDNKQQCVPKCVEGSRLYNDIKCIKETNEPFVYGDGETCDPDHLEACKSYTYKNDEIPKTLTGSICDTDFAVKCNDNGDGTTTVYFNSSATCTEGERHNFPTTIGLNEFQPAYSTVDNEGCVDKFLTSEITDDKSISDCFGTSSSYICGLDKGNAIVLRKVEHPGCQDPNICTTHATEYTQKFNAIINDGITCNLVDIINENEDYNVSVSNKIEKSCKEDEIFNKKTLSCESINVGDDTSICTSSAPTQYKTDCTNFKNCFKPSNSCPFEESSGSLDCIYKCAGTDKYTLCDSTDECFKDSSKVKGYITPSNSPPCKNRYCMVQDNTYSCHEADKCVGDCSPYEENKYKNCSDGAECNVTVGDIISPNGNKTITGECSHGGENAVSGNGHCVRAGWGISSLHHWEGGNPYAGVTAMIMTNNNGDRCGGHYDTSNHGNAQSDLRDLTVKQSPCPSGTKPFFFASKKDNSSTKDCNGKYSGVYSRIDYQCCDTLKFKYNKQEPTSLPAENASVCIPQVKSIKANSNGATSILIGRNDGKNDPTNNHDACDINKDRGYDKLKRLLTDANNAIWLPESQNCT